MVASRRFLRETMLLACGGKQRRRPWRCSYAAGVWAEAGGEVVDEDEEGAMEMLQIGTERQKNVLILMSDTGGGHRASAEAIRDAFHLEFGDDYRVFVKDLCKEHSGWPLNAMEKSYKFLLRHSQLWKLAFHSTSPRWVHSLYLDGLAALFHSDVDRCYCPSEEVANRALLDGLAPRQIRVFGLPIRPSFCFPTKKKDSLRQELEMEPYLPAVLLMGGGEGTGPVKETAEALEEKLHDRELGCPIGQVVIICGRNSALHSSLLSIQWKVPIKVRGFELQIDKWMAACDCIITKAGPGTISESLIKGLPIILNDFIPGQEVGNIPYVVDNGAGVFSSSPKEAANQVARWFGREREELERLSLNALKLAQPNAVFDIVRDIHELVQLQSPAARLTHTR